LNEKKFLELGAGSGLISFVAAQNNAVVTATDINTVAIEYLKINSDKNHLPVQIILSDLFDEIPEEQFDIIAINPPYYKKDPQTQADLAWHCGENGEYFKKLFSNLAAYIKPSTEVFMIICDGCDIKMIHDYAAQNNFLLNCVHTESNLIELNFIYKIENLLFKQI
jgi:release factor glutamine methyltransferase